MYFHYKCIQVLRLLFAFLIFASNPNIGKAQAPSSLFPDITSFKVEYPLDSAGNDYEGVDYDDRNNPHIKSYSKSNLSGHVPPVPYSEYFYVSGNEMVFKSHCAGALTSVNAYPRTELREQINGQNTFWDYSDEHELNVTLRVTNVPDIKQEVCVVQLKGTNTPSTTSGTDEVLRVEYRKDGNSGWHLTINEASGPKDILNYSIGQYVKIRVYVNNDNVSLEMENLNNGDTYQYNYSSAYSHGYFKAGAYTQSSIWAEKNGTGSDEDPDAYGEVRFSQFVLGAACEQVTLNPYYHIDNGSLQSGSQITATANDIVELSPQPGSNSNWSWSGPNGFTASTREITLQDDFGTYIATYTDTYGCEIDLVYQVEQYSCQIANLTAYYTINNGAQQSGSQITAKASDLIELSPQPGSNSNWSWSGPNGFTASTREITLQDDFGTYTATYTDTYDCTTQLIFDIEEHTCQSASLTAYYSINNGTLQSGSQIIALTTDLIQLSPQPGSNSNWSWSGPNGFTASTRELAIEDDFGTYIATYTDAYDCTTQLRFDIEMHTCQSATIFAYYRINNGGLQIGNQIITDPTELIKLSPLPGSNPNWSWSGPNGYFASTREITLQNNFGNYIGTYLDSFGCLTSITYEVIDRCSQAIILYNGSDDFTNSEELVYITSNTITATNYIGQNTDILYNGGAGVTLDIGFEVSANGVLQVQITGCNE